MERILLMIYSDIYQKLTRSEQFKAWSPEHSDFYLTHFYTTLNNKYQITTPWELGFYSKSQDKIATFIVDKKITLKPEEEVFKKKGEVNPLDLQTIKIDHQEALKLFQEQKEKHHSPEQLLTGFLILQNLNHQIIWNISFATRSMHILNFKLDAQTKELISSQLINFIERK